MPLVRNVSAVPHRYYLYARRQYLTWAPGEVKDVLESIADQVCRAHPEKMVLDALVPEEHMPSKEPPKEPDELPPDEMSGSAQEVSVEPMPDELPPEDVGGDIAEVSASGNPRTARRRAAGG